MFAASKSGRAVSAATTDPYFPYVPLLLNTTSTNAQQNNTFLDSSTNNFTITRNGTPTQGAFTPYQPSGYWSGYFNGSTDYLSNTTTASTGLNLSTGSFTIECWIYLISLRSDFNCITTFQNTAGSPSGLIFGIDNLYQPYIGNGVVLGKSGSAAISLGVWNHVAVVSNGTNIQFYTNGVANGSSQAFNPNAAQYFNIGGSFTTGTLNYPITGYISNLRVVKGVAVYTGAFTPPTAPLAATQSAGTNISAITGTQCSLLACSSNRFIDIGGQVTPNVITVNGTPKVQAFQPFSPAASYSAATYGGSGYFNGTSDFLSNSTNNTALAMGSGDFTIEFWLNAPSDSAVRVIYDSRVNTTTATGGFQIYQQSGTIYVYGGAATATLLCSASVTYNAWNHFAVVRNGSSTGNVKLYINGALASTYGSADASNYSQGYLNIGCYLPAGSPSSYYSGYLSNFRMVKGTAIYTAAFTPPTLPVTAVSGTSLLTNFTNAGIYDAAWQNNALTVGDAQTSITQYKWSPTSMRFDGTGDYLTWPAGNSAVFGTGDFTVEAWVYCSSNPHTNGMFIIDTRNSGQTTNWCFYFGSGNGLTWLYSSTVIATSTVYSTGTWYYVAYTRSSNTGRLYVNGTQVATGADSNNYNVAPTIAYIATRYNQVNYFDGYIQDLRITKGVARTITTPTAAFPTR